MAAKGEGREERALSSPLSKFCSRVGGVADQLPSLGHTPPASAEGGSDLWEGVMLGLFPFSLGMARLMHWSGA